MTFNRTSVAFEEYYKYGTETLDKLNAQLGKAGRSARNLSVGKRRIYQTSTEFNRQLSWIIIWGFSMIGTESASKGMIKKCRLSDLSLLCILTKTTCWSIRKNTFFSSLVTFAFYPFVYGTLSGDDHCYDKRFCQNILDNFLLNGITRIDTDLFYPFSVKSV